MASKETVYTTIVMQDGKVVDFPGDRKLQKSSKISADGTVVVRLDFRNTEFREFTIPAQLYAKFASYGAEQKLGDAVSALKDVDDMVVGMDELIEQLYNGDWTSRNPGNALAGASVLMRAICEAYSKTPAQVRAYLKEKSQADKLALRQSATLKPVIARIESEKATKVNTAAIEAMHNELAGLGSDAVSEAAA